MYDKSLVLELKKCTICPRNCGVDRIAGNKGYCNLNAAYHIASICIHKGEEPILGCEKGICNVFFSHCNLQCKFCQNFQISKNSVSVINHEMSLETIVSKISNFYDQGIKTIGFVSGSHFAYHCIEIVKAIRKTGRSPIFVYNTNAYDTVETIQKFEDYIDIYLPDFKYVSPILSKQLSGSENYFDFASKAIKEMYKQKGSSLILNDDGIAESGLIIRHLILPGYIEDSFRVLEYISSEISTSIAMSIMAQYYPTTNFQSHTSLNRTLSRLEYDSVLDYAAKLGFWKGWNQSLESESYYRPDFEMLHPFEFKNKINCESR